VSLEAQYVAELMPIGLNEDELDLTRSSPSIPLSSTRKHPRRSDCRRLMRFA
jgi:hypothetical protein